MSAEFDPWEVVAQRPDVVMVSGELPCDLQLVHQLRDGTHVLAFTAGLSREVCTRLLAHELLHMEQGGGCPYTGPWGLPEPGIEERIDAEVDRRLGLPV